MYTKEQLIGITEQITSIITPAQRIDFTKGIFECNGNQYYFAPLEMCYQRLAPFKQKQSKVLKGLSIDELALFIVDLRSDLTTGESVSYKEDIHNAIDKLNSMCTILEGHDINNLASEKIDEWFELCTYFILRKDEDVFTYDKRIAEDKIEDWKKFMFPYDFFLAVLLRSNSYIQHSQNIINVVKEAKL